MANYKFMHKDGILIAFGDHNIAGSHKLNAVRGMVEDGICHKKILLGGNQAIIDRTGGNLGLCMSIVANPLGLRAVAVIPKRFSGSRRHLARAYGCEVHEFNDRLGETADEQIVDFIDEERRKGNPKPYVLNQFSNRANVNGHYLYWAAPLANEVMRLMTDFGYDSIELVSGVGSGGSLKAFQKAFQERFHKVRICLVQPEGYDVRADQLHIEHRFEGIAVGVIPSLFSVSDVDDFVFVSDEEINEGREWMKKTTGLLKGYSSIANLIAARKRASKLRDNGERRLVITMTFDRGDVYALDRFSK